MKRYDYRRQYKNMSVEQLQKCLTKYKEKLGDNIGICESNVEYYSKRISYINQKINKTAP